MSCAIKNTLETVRQCHDRTLTKIFCLTSWHTHTTMQKRKIHTQNNLDKTMHMKSKLKFCKVVDTRLEFQTCSILGHFLPQSQMQLRLSEIETFPQCAQLASLHLIFATLSLRLIRGVSNDRTHRTWQKQKKPQLVSLQQNFRNTQFEVDSGCLEQFHTQDSVETEKKRRIDAHESFSSVGLHRIFFQPTNFS